MEMEDAGSNKFCVFHPGDHFIISCVKPKVDIDLCQIHTKCLCAVYMPFHEILLA